MLAFPFTSSKYIGVGVPIPTLAPLTVITCEVCFTD